MSAAFSSEITDDRKKWHNTFKVLKEKHSQLRILYLAKIPFKNKDTDTLRGKKGSDTRHSRYQEILGKPKMLGESSVHIHIWGFHFRNSNYCTMVGMCVSHSVMSNSLQPHGW